MGDKNQDQGEAGREHRATSSAEMEAHSTLSATLSGRELDAAVAERVMGWWSYHGIWCRGEAGSVGNGTGWISYPVSGAAFQYALGGREYGEYTPQATYDADAEQHVFAPSTDIAAAMEAVKALAEHLIFASMDFEQMWNVSFWKDGTYVGGDSDGSLSLAICRAALDAVSTQPWDDCKITTEESHGQAS